MTERDKFNLKSLYKVFKIKNYKYSVENRNWVNPPVTIELTVTPEACIEKIRILMAGNGKLISKGLCSIPSAKEFSHIISKMISALVSSSQ